MLKTKNCIVWWKTATTKPNHIDLVFILRKC